MNGQPYVVLRNERRRLHDRARRAQQRNQTEVCGVLLVDIRRRLRFAFLPNRSTQQAAWALSRADLRAAGQQAPSGWRPLGTFHSHVVGVAMPGPRDVREGFYRGHQLVYDVCGREAKLFRRLRRGTRLIAKEVPLVNERRR
jgi:proteasome lid subunit RPN8/RPN11